jgi:NAD(P)-dependent dehydrogenase (short-subunit alcohol dehydrogenase family)
MKIVVITGSTRGIGYGLAREFLRRGCAVAISGRSAGTVESAAVPLAVEFGAERVLGVACDVREFDQVQALWNAAAEKFGRVDIWINNAGGSHRPDPVEALDPGRVREVVETNLIGAIYGAAVAMRAMRAQGSGAIYNLEGLGSDGRRIAGLSVYGATKYALAYLTDSLAQEAKGSGVIVGAIRPGMVMTDMITGQYAGREEEFQRRKRLFEIIAAPVEDVTPRIAEQVLANRRNGARIHAGGMLRMAGRMVKVAARGGKK